MNTQKTIALQAKKSLENNWITVITSVLLIFTIAIGLNSIENIFLLAFNLIDTATGEPKAGCDNYVMIADCALLFSLFLLSPIINGFFKTTYMIANNNKPQFSETFFYFKGIKKYFKTLLLNLFLGLVITACVFAFNFDYVVELIVNSLFADTSETAAMVTEAIFNLIFITISFFLSSFIYLLFLNYPLFLYADDCNSGVFRCIGKGIAMGFKNFGKSLKLFFHFLGWIALCFFIVTGFYVLPYITVSFANSAKWLISINKGRNNI